MKMRNDSPKRLLAVALGVVIALASMAPRAGAAEIEVTNADDDGPGSLREAITKANPGDRIVFHASLDGETVTLESDLPLIDDDATFDTDDADLTITDGALRIDARWSVTDSIDSEADFFSDATFYGNGTIQRAVTSEGTLSAGDGIGSIGTLSFGQDLTINGGEVVVDVASPPGTDNDLYDVTGTAAVTGGTVTVRFAQPRDQPYTEGMAYTFLQSAGGFSNDDFDRIMGNLAFLEPSFRDELGDPTAAGVFVIVDNDRNFTTVASSCNQQFVAGYLDDFRGRSELPEITDRFRSSTIDQVRRGFEQLSGEIYPSMVSAQLQYTSLNLAMLRNQLALDLPRGGEGMQTTGWVRGYGLSGDADPDACGTRGYHLRLGGTEIAFQRGWDIGLAIGGFANLGWSEIQLDGLSQRGQVASYQFGGSFQHVGRYAYLLGIGGGGHQDYNVHRRIDAAMLDGAMSSDFDGNQTFGYLELGTLLETSGYFWTPHAALQHIRLNQGEFSESPADPDGTTASVALDGEEIDADSTRSIFGLSLERTGPTSIGPATTKLRAGWMHEYGKTHESLRSRFADPDADGADPLDTRGVDLGRDWAILDVHLQWAVHPGVRLLGSYQGQFNGRQSFHTGAGGLEARW